MRIYVAGPMTGIKDYNYPAFNEEAARLREEGHDVLNPAENYEGRTDLPYDAYIRRAITDVTASGGLSLLPGWRASTGARMEFSIAVCLSLPVFSRDDGAVRQWSDREVQFVFDNLGRSEGYSVRSEGRALWSSERKLSENRGPICGVPGCHCDSDRRGKPIDSGQIGQAAKRARA